MKHRRVVANYIFLPPADPTPSPSLTITSTNPCASPPTASQVLLFRRSHHPNIRSYRGLLAPISGSIDASDASPLAAATREIREETGLVTDVDLRLETVGQRFGFTDAAAGRSWEVYPFGWRLLLKKGWEGDLEARVRLDWEHEGFEVVDPAEVVLRDEALRARCVPRIEESMGRVWLGEEGGVFGGEVCMRSGNLAGETFRKGMVRLRDDKENGARVLATNALRCLRGMAIAMYQDDRDTAAESVKAWQILRISAWHLVHSARPSMNAAIGSAVSEALQAIKPLILKERTSAEAIKAQLDERIQSRETTSQRLAITFSDYAARLSNAASSINIVTLSSSSTIKAALLYLCTTSSFTHINISILESRPRCEGASLAALLLSALQPPSIPTPDITDRPRPNISLTILPDSHLPSLLTRFTATSPPPLSSSAPRTLLLLGADRISPHGAVLNKTLSLFAAVLARTLTAGATKVAVLAETDKLAPVAELELYRSDPERSREREMAAHAGENGDAGEVMGAWEAAGVGEGDVGRLRDATDQDKASREGEDGAGVVEMNVRNETFEWVEPEWIDVYITEKGVMEMEEIGDVCVTKTEIEDEVFKDLYD